MQHSDNQAARVLNEARDKLFQCFIRNFIY